MRARVGVAIRCPVCEREWGPVESAKFEAMLGWYLRHVCIKPRQSCTSVDIFATVHPHEGCDHEWGQDA